MKTINIIILFLVCFCCLGAGMREISYTPEGKRVDVVYSSFYRAEGIGLSDQLVLNVFASDKKKHMPILYDFARSIGALNSSDMFSKVYILLVIKNESNEEKNIALAAVSGRNRKGSPYNKIALASDAKQSHDLQPNSTIEVGFIGNQFDAYGTELHLRIYSDINSERVIKEVVVPRLTIDEYKEYKRNMKSSNHSLKPTMSLRLQF